MHISWLTYSFYLQYGPANGSVCNRNKYKDYLLGLAGNRCVGLTKLTLSCVDCLEILGGPNTCNPRGLSRYVQGTLYLFVRVEDVMDFVYARKKAHHMKRIELFYF